jgi:transcription-repair coupling factor (superfamily II helicase)
MPNIRIRTAHGQMHAHELEEVMLDFLERRVDVLLATKIIESGIDIPNVNTMIINRADRFGMAELYQLRGRVGRSNVQAYAYLLTPPISTLPRNTIRRLQAVQEFTELGSGFNLAMRDLEIRGAGNLLGAEQSGFIESMGFETYTRILEEAVQELKEEEFAELFDRTSAPATRKAETVVEVRFDALIPDTYVRDDTERLAIYRRLYAMGSEEQITEVREELVDRFGVLPAEAEHLLAAVRIRLHAEVMGFVRVTIGPTTMEIEFPPDTATTFYESEQFQKIMQAVSTRKGGALSQAGTSLRYVASLPQSEDRLQVLEHARQILVRLEQGQ